MKKIIIILFLFLLCISCYLIYKTYQKEKLNILSIGDEIANNPYLLNYQYNNDFINKDYDIKDLYSIIKYNQELTINNETLSIHRLLKKADILIISIGMNDIYYKLNNDSKEIYTYLNNIINTYEEILKEINNYQYEQVYILGYYNINNKYNDIFTYTNYKIKKISKKYNYTYLDLNNILKNKDEYLKDNNHFELNNKGKYQIYQLIVENLKKS